MRVSLRTSTFYIFSIVETVTFARVRLVHFCQFEGKKSKERCTVCLKSYFKTNMSMFAQQRSVKEIRITSVGEFQCHSESPSFSLRMEQGQNIHKVQIPVDHNRHIDYRQQKQYQCQHSRGIYFKLWSWLPANESDNSTYSNREHNYNILHHYNSYVTTIIMKRKLEQQKYLRQNKWH